MLRASNWNQRIVIAVLIGAIGGAGCSRTKPYQRSARRRVPLPPPVVQFEPDPASETPLDLHTTQTPGRSGTSAAYGPPPRMSVAPSGSTGYSVDMRYPSYHGVRPTAPPARTRASAGPRLVSPKTEAADETPIKLPPANGSDRQATTNGTAPERAATTPKKDTPRFTMTTEPGVATGAPVKTLDEIRALKDEGFRTILNLLPEDEADPAEPFEVNRAEVAYISLPVTPKTLNRDLLEQFNRVIAQADRPIYIHDSTGSLTGAMWYLNRLLDAKIPEPAARRQAAKAGLKDSGADDLTTELWLAIQRIIAESPQ